MTFIPILDDKSARIITLDRSGCFAENRVGVHTDCVASVAVGILTAYPGMINEAEEPVRIIGSAHVPRGALAIGEDLARQLELTDGAPHWRLDRVPTVVQATEVVLEPLAGMSSEEAKRRLRRSEQIAGSLLYLPPRSTRTPQRLNVGGDEYAVRQVAPHEYGEASVIEITGYTDLQVMVPSDKAGVDIVLLADCSGSMGVPDMTAADEVGGKSFVMRKGRRRRISRMEALHGALEKLLRVRGVSPGRNSRIALLGFTTEAFNIYPGQGMAQLTDENYEATIEQLRSAVRRLSPVDGKPTDIGVAIDAAGELLHTQGHPGNEKLIVLVSDGGHFVEKGVEATGETVGATELPVSVMSMVHMRSRARLHAIGISNMELYRQCVVECNAREHKSLEPRHDLLERLVEVGGGNPAHIGDTDVLERYFQSLGEGVLEAVGRPLPARAVGLQPAEIADLQQFAALIGTSTSVDAGVSREREELSQALLAIYNECSEASDSLLEGSLFDNPHAIRNFMTAISKDVRDRQEFSRFVNMLYEGVHKSIRPELLSGATAQRTDADAPTANGKISRFPALQDLVDLNHGYRAAGKQAASDKVEEIQKRLVGTAVIEPNDMQTWSRLQVAIMRSIQTVLEKVLSELQQAAAEDATPQQKPESGFSTLMKGFDIDS